MASVRVVRVPAGEAPEWVRQAWVGLELPLPDDMPSRPMYHPSQGVLTGAKTPLGQILSQLLRPRRTLGYSIEVLDAIAVLERSSPDAARWWREPVPRMMHSGDRFVFGADECEEVVTW
jgi:hypothetical protein